MLGKAFLRGAIMSSLMKNTIKQKPFSEYQNQYPRSYFFASRIHYFFLASLAVITFIGMGFTENLLINGVFAVILVVLFFCFMISCLCCSFFGFKKLSEVGGMAIGDMINKAPSEDYLPNNNSNTDTSFESANNNNNSPIV